MRAREQAARKSQNLAPQIIKAYVRVVDRDAVRFYRQAWHEAMRTHSEGNTAVSLVSLTCTVRSSQNETHSASAR